MLHDSLQGRHVESKACNQARVQVHFLKHFVHIYADLQTAQCRQLSVDSNNRPEWIIVASIADATISCKDSDNLA